MLVVRAWSVHTNAEMVLSTLQRVDSKEEEKRQQHQPHQILASHAARTMRARVDLKLDFRLQHLQCQLPPTDQRPGFEPPSPGQVTRWQDRRQAQRGQQKNHQTILELVIQTRQKSSENQPRH